MTAGSNPERRRSKPARVLAWLLLTVLVIGAAITADVNVNFSNFPGRGRVLDYKTREPIAGVELKGNCSRPNFIHGSRLLKVLRTRSDAEGRYRFDFAETWHCAHFVPHPEKVHYVDLLAAQIPNVVVGMDLLQGVPKITWMLKETDVVPLRLDGLFAQTGGEAHYADGSGRRAYLEEFSWTIGRLTEAKKIALSDAQRAWIAERFCPLLSRQFAAIPATDRRPHGPSAAQFDSDVEEWRATCPQVAAR